MKIGATVLFMMMAINTLVAAADPEPFLKSAPMPFYPPLARQARIEGIVTLRMLVTQDGTVTVDAASGHPLLRDATAKYAKGWKFGWEHPCTCTARRNVTFVYKISEKEAGPDTPIAIVRWFGNNRVEVETHPPHIETVIDN